ncbi:MAG: hypothetical protein K2Y22_00190 [Candidatus Obscuribacterales bacterium]|nr:hypothetical protein [Candidatus Obscuribacterales bacterium]
MAKEGLKQTLRANQTINAVFHDSKWRDEKCSEVYDKDGLYRGIPYTHDYRSALREEILAKHTPSQEASRSDWMRSLTQTSLSMLASSRGTRLQVVQQQAKYDNSTADLIGKIFSILRTYAYQYNHSIGWSELHVTCSIPGFVTEVMRYNILREASETLTYFRARLSTSSYSLVMRGRNHKIEVFLIPVSKSIGLTQSEKNFKPIVTFTSRLEGNSVEWSMEDQPLVDGHMELIAMELFTMLISASNENMQTYQPAAKAASDLTRLSQEKVS